MRETVTVNVGLAGTAGGLSLSSWRKTSGSPGNRVI